MFLGLNILGLLGSAWKWFTGTQAGRITVLVFAAILAIGAVYLHGKSVGKSDFTAEMDRKAAKLKGKMENAHVSDTEEDVLNDLDRGKF